MTDRPPPTIQLSDEDICASLAHALRQRSAAAREWQRQANQWEQRWRDVTKERDQAHRAIERAAGDCSELERQLAELTQLVGAETPIAALTLAQTWQAERAHMQERIAELESEMLVKENDHA